MYAIEIICFLEHLLWTETHNVRVYDYFEKRKKTTTQISEEIKILD